MNKNIKNNIQVMSPGKQTKNFSLTLKTEKSMKKSLFILMAFAIVFFTSCTEGTDFTHNPVKTETAVKRSGQNIDVTILLTDNTTMTLSGDEVVIGNASGTTFTVSVDGSGNHSATQITISHDKAGLKITNGNEVYENKASAVITASGSVLYMSIDPGNISTSGTGQIVIDEITGV